MDVWYVIQNECEAGHTDSGADSRPYSTTAGKLYWKQWYMLCVCARVHVCARNSLSTGTIHLLLTITGTAVQEVDRDKPLSTQSSWRSPSATDMKELMKKYVSYWGSGHEVTFDLTTFLSSQILSRSLSFDLWNDIGHLTVLSKPLSLMPHLR